MTTLSPSGGHGNRPNASSGRRGHVGVERSVVAPVSPVHRGSVDPRRSVHRGEGAADVDGVGADGQAVDGRIDVGEEAGEQGPGGGAEPGQPVAGRPVDLGELAADVDRGSVGRDRDVLDHAVDRGSERGERAGGDVVGQQVGAHHLRRAALGSTGRSGAGELSRRVHGVADHHLSPYHPVVLRGRQRVARHRLRHARIGGRRVGRGYPRLADHGQADHGGKEKYGQQAYGGGSHRGGFPGRRRQWVGRSLHNLYLRIGVREGPWPSRSLSHIRRRMGGDSTGPDSAVANRSRTAWRWIA